MKFILTSLGREPRKEKTMNIRKMISYLMIICFVASMISCTCSNSNNPDTMAPTAMASATPGETDNPTQELTVEPTIDPTAVQTDVPTDIPTDEPTATPIPTNWYIDPSGIIPPTVEILVPDDNTLTDDVKTKWCIAKVNGQIMVQKWVRDKGLEKQWQVPEELCEAKSIIASDYSGYLTVFALFNRHRTESCWVYSETPDGSKYLLVKSKENDDVEKGILIITYDNQAIWYEWGNDFYKYHEFDAHDDICIAHGAAMIIVNDEDAYFLHELEWVKKNLEPKN